MNCTMRLLLVFLFINCVSSFFYKGIGEKSVSKTRQIYEEDNVRSGIMCIQKCLPFQADALYAGLKCVCLSKKENGNQDFFLDAGAQIITGIYYIKTDVARPTETKVKGGNENTSKPKEGMERIMLVTEEKEIHETKSKALTKLNKLTKQYVIYVEVKPTLFDGINRAVIQLTNRANVGEVGSRMPLVQYVRNRKGALRICTTLNDDPDFCAPTPKQYPYKKYLSIKISQLLQSNEYNFSIAINNEHVFSEINKKPEEIENVKVFIGSPEEKARNQHGFIRLFWIEVEE